MGFLSLVILAPILAGIVLLLLPIKNHGLSRAIGIGASAGVLILTAMLKMRLDGGTGGLQLTESAPWIAKLGVGYSVGVDTLATWLIVLAAALGLGANALSVYIHERPRTFAGIVLLLTGAMIGAFSSTDLLLFFVFFELTLIPMFLLIAVWGQAGRMRAASKFLIYTFGGSIFMLVGMIALALRYQEVTGSMSFNLMELQRAAASGALWAGHVELENLIFWSFTIAFLVKSPAFPFHTWIADTYGEAPAAAPMLSAAMVKLGTFGLLRFCLPLFPDTAKAAAPILATLGAIGIVYGAIVAAVQPDLRRMMAYSTLSHMGFVLLGLFSLNDIGLVGAGYGQIAHGITAGAMAFLFGVILSRYGNTEFAQHSGLKARMPVFAFFFLIVSLSTLGLPTTIGFVGEFLSLMGAFQAGMGGAIPLAIAVIAGFGVVVAAAYTLIAFQRVFTGPARDGAPRAPDLNPYEIAVCAIFAGLVIAGGLLPTAITKSMEPALVRTKEMVLNPPGSRPIFVPEAPETATARLDRP